MTNKIGIPLVQEAVTFAATLLSGLERNNALAERERKACHEVREMLEKAEKVLYGHEEPITM